MTTSQMELSIDRELPLGMQNFSKAINALRAGKIVLLLDAFDRENEGDLIVAAEKITKETMNFLIKKGSGVVCLAMPKARLDKLGLPLMSPDNTNFFQTAFTVSIEARHGVTTGVSAKDRAHTIQVAIADDAESSHLARPGHVFPLAAQKCGVFDRMGHTEGSVDLMRIAGLKPGAVLCELMNEDGSMTVGEDRVRFARDFDIPVISVEEIFFFRFQTEKVFTRSSTEINSRFGKLTWQSYCFLDHIVVDIFYTAELTKNLETPAKFSITSSDNLHKRFFAQVLERSEDDTFINALNRVANKEIHGAIMCSLHKTPRKKTAHELKLFEMAAICRVFKELEITQIDGSLLDEDLGRIAHNYFSMGVR